MPSSISTTAATPAQGIHKLTKAEYEAFRQGYVAAAEFTTRDERDGVEEDTHLDAAGFEHAPELVLTISADIERFLAKPVKLIPGVGDVADLIRLCADSHKPGSPEDCVWNHAGRDFWYTREGHGCGFWDGDWPEQAGEVLTEISQLIGTDEWYVGGDDRVYSVSSYRFRAPDHENYVPAA